MIASECSFDALMQTHSVFHGSFSDFLVDSEFDFRYHFAIVTVEVKKLHGELLGGAK